VSPGKYLAGGLQSGCTANLTGAQYKFRAANIQKALSADILLDMLKYLAEYYQEKGEEDKTVVQFKIAKGVIEAFREDFLTDGTSKTIFSQKRPASQRAGRFPLIIPSQSHSCVSSASRHN